MIASRLQVALQTRILLCVSINVNTVMLCNLQANVVSASVFMSGQDSHSLPVIMKRLQNVTIKRSRGVFNKMSIINKMRALKASASKKRFDVAAPEGSATPELGSEADGELLSHIVLLDCSLVQARRVLLTDYSLVKVRRLPSITEPKWRLTTQAGCLQNPSCTCPGVPACLPLGWGEGGAGGEGGVGSVHAYM